MRIDHTVDSTGYEVEEGEHITDADYPPVSPFYNGVEIVLLGISAFVGFTVVFLIADFLLTLRIG